MKPKPLILASRSPRRRELMQHLKIPFEAHNPAYEENTQANLCPAEEVLLFAREKAKSLKEDHPNTIIIGCDTLVEIAGKKLGKPKDNNEATAMLNELSDRIHRVLTGVSILDTGTNQFKEVLGQTLIKFRELSPEEIDSYVASGDPLDKAGAYAIQGPAGKFIELMEGDYFNVVGLPLRDLGKLLEEMGFELKIDWQTLYSKTP